MSLSEESYDSQKVHKWLKGLFEEGVPPFDESEEVIEFLKKLMSKNIAAENDVKEIIKTEERFIDTYREKTEEMKVILDGEISSLSSQTMEKVESIALAANKLNLKEPTLTNFLFSIQDAENKQMEKMEEDLLNNYHISCLQRKYTEVTEENEKLQRNLKTLENVVQSQEKFKDQNLDAKGFFQKKIEDYRCRIQKEEMILEDKEFDPSLQHHILVKKAADVKELEEEVQGLQSKLDSYQSLPPNEILTMLKVEETRNILSALEEEFQELLSSEEKRSDIPL